MQDSIDKINCTITSLSGGRGAYISPRIELIELDNEISLALESSPPDGPGEGAFLAPDYQKNDPFKITLG